MYSYATFHKSSSSPEGTVHAGGYENIAAEGEASQIDDYESWASAGSGRAIDGNTDGNWKNSELNSISLTNSREGAWWKLSFPRPYFVYSMEIYNRVDDFEERIENVEVSVGDKLVSTLKYEVGKNLYSLENVAMVGLEIVFRRRQGLMQLAEVMVFGEPAIPSKISPMCAVFV